jgi:Tol biopolymer transport system component
MYRGHPGCRRTGSSRRARWSDRFQSNRDGHPEIYIMHADGTTVIKTSHDQFSDSEPAFSPTGTKIVFRSRRRGNGAELFSVNRAGQGLEQLTRRSGGTADVYPSWGR